MKNRIQWIVWTIIFISTTIAGSASAAEEKIRVLNPRGIRPAIQKIPMAERFGSLDGMTIYIVDTKYPNTKPFVHKLQENLAAKYPKTTWVNVDKNGNYMQDDPALWAEIKQKGDGAIVLIGH